MSENHFCENAPRLMIITIITSLHVAFKLH